MPPLVIVRAVADRQIVLAVSPEALASGIRPGLTLTQARALCAHVTHADHDPRRERLALEALGRWMTRFTPSVSVCRGSGDARKDDEPQAYPTTAAVFLDVTGCELLFGGIENIVAQVGQALARMRLDARVAAAPTPGAAWALAYGAGRDLSTRHIVAGTGSAPEGRQTLARGASPGNGIVRTPAARGAGVRTLGHGSPAHLRAPALTPPPGAARPAGTTTRDSCPGPGSAAPPGLSNPTRQNGSGTQGRDGCIVSEQELPDALAPLSPSSLRIDDALAESLHHLGLSTVGQLMALPREVLPARFGTQLSLRLDQALGRVDEPLVPLQYKPPVSARMDFDGVVSSLEAIWSVFRELVGRVIGQLARRGEGARRMEVDFFRDGLPPLRRSVLLSRPSRDPVNLFNLFRCATEELLAPPPRSRLRGRRPGSVAPTRVEDLQSDGFIGMRLSAPLCEPLADEQVSLLGREEYAGQLELDRLIERLRVRLGEEAVVRAELVEAYVPERAYRLDGLDGEGTKARRHEGTKSFEKEVYVRQSFRDHASGNRDGRHDRSIRQPLRASVPSCLRAFSRASPLSLLPRPEEIRVMVSPSDDLEGKPAMFSHEGKVRRVVHCVGPERIAGHWWDGHDKTRDYFDVQDEAGRRFWVFRVAQTGKWYLHGGW